MTPAEATELVTCLIADALERAATELSVVGELVDIKDQRERSGRVYFALQEGPHRFRCQMSAALAEELGDYLKAGTVLECHGALVVAQLSHQPRVELAVERIEVLTGELSPRAQLLEDLQTKGWLDDKRELPEYPRRIGLVTSAESEAVADFMSVVEDLEAELEVEVVAVSLASEQSIVAGLCAADGERYDVIVLTRGGGEGLGIFDSYEVAAAIHQTRTPVVSAVGHERDWTIADQLADARAATPTAAARLVLAGHSQAAERALVLTETSAGIGWWQAATLVLTLLLGALLLALYFKPGD